MNQAERDHFKTALEHLRDALDGSGVIKVQPNCAPDVERPDDDFQALNEMHQSIASGRNQNRSLVLAQVRTALELMAEDPEEYGLCHECEEPIPRARLALMPYVERCVQCQSVEEETGSPKGRRKLTDYLG
jgi:DnaK suppressor protein